jgi:hypothetical protein
VTDYSGWELVDNEKEVPSSPDYSDWEMVSSSQQQEPQENFKTALSRAPGRITQDVYNSAMNFAGEIPGYYEKAKTEVPGIFSTLIKHPVHLAGQGLAGLTELGHGILNAPHGIAEYGSNRLHLIPEKVTSQIPYQKDISQDISGLLGNPEYPGESLMRGTTRNALNLMGVKGVGSALNPLKLSKKNIIKDVLQTRKENKKIYSEKYNDLFNEAKEQGIGDVSNAIPEIDYETIKKYSPSKKIEGLNVFLENPSVKNAHKAKSDLLRIDRDLNKLSTLNTAERKHSTAVKNAINSLQNNMFTHESGLRNLDLFERYNNIQKGYALDVVPYNNKSIKKYLSQELTDKELINSLSKGAFRAKRGKYHPQFGIREKILPIGTALGTVGLGKFLYDKFDLLGSLLDKPGYREIPAYSENE